MLDSDPKKFMPVMDWVVYQIKILSGVDGYPFVIMKGADLGLIIKNLMNTYCGVIYLDSRKDFKIPENCLFIRHQEAVSLTKCEITDCSATSSVLSHHMFKGIRR